MEEIHLNLENPKTYQPLLLFIGFVFVLVGISTLGVLLIGASVFCYGLELMIKILDNLRE